MEQAHYLLHKVWSKLTTCYIKVWSKPPLYGAAPDSLVGHSTVAVGSELFIWGGGDGKRAHSGLNIIDTSYMSWSRPTASGSQPMAHVGHSAVCADAKMFVFGGYGQRQYWNELVVLDTGIMAWMRPHTSGAPPAQCVLHSATLAGGSMVVVGGALDEKPIDQIAALDLSTMRWSRLGGSTWEGIRPLPRFGHAAEAIGGRIFLFGGTTGNAPDSFASFLFNSGFELGYRRYALDGLDVIDVEKKNFSQPHYAGESPPPCYRATMTSVRSKLFVFGGVGNGGENAPFPRIEAPFPFFCRW